MPLKSPKKSWWSSASRRFWLWGGGIVGVLLLVLGGVVFWYQAQLTAKNPAANGTIRFTIADGDTIEAVARNLESKGIIRSALAFQLYSRLTDTSSEFKAGSYSVGQSYSVEQLTKKFIKGQVDQITVTLLPGATLKSLHAILEKAGFKKSDIEAALSTDYTSPLLATKPPEATLEGYLYPETYYLQVDQTVGSFVEQSLSLFYEKLQQTQLLSHFTERGLTIHQALTLASIVQREVANEADAKQVAQVFYSRLALGVPLGADATFVYAAELQGVEPRVSLESPYNTRIIKGLPPGPIGAPSLSMLEAVARPAAGDFLYFVTGDDGRTHFSRTNEEHEQNTQRYCRENCSIFRQ